MKGNQPQSSAFIVVNFVILIFYLKLPYCHVLSAGHYERAPYNASDIRSVYHVREYDVFKLKQLKDPVDIFMSHDWPLGITDYGNWEKLIRSKPFFKEEVVGLFQMQTSCQC